ncbi:serine hydrolase [Croceicoccus sp. F390]|uniref:Beta-lactamase n=1 Tax=Croceicoccus esteveae TaxID=3075597 RepID=A0ABU2ZK32_9SPHN|nr:serine hydrolase [Croceicoccus sp. F390]MDT0576736.1 serine hydrolase [Croceicoccus sp. F390]
MNRTAPSSARAALCLLAGLGLIGAAPQGHAQSFEEFISGDNGAILDGREKIRSMPPVLRQQLVSIAAADRGRIGVAALDLTTGASVSILGEQAFPMASTSKIAIAATFLAGVDAGRYRLQDRYPLQIPVASRPFDGPVAPVKPGMQVAAERLIELMITRSDNSATDAMLKAVGGPKAVTEWLRNAGLSRQRIDRDIATLVRDDGEFDPVTVVDERDSTPPEEMVALIAGLYQGKWLSPESRDLLVNTMTRTVTGSRRIKAGLPSGSRFGHKTGTLNNTASDVGFVELPDGRVIVMAIYVTGQGGRPQRDQRIAQITRVLYDGFTESRFAALATAQTQN